MATNWVIPTTDDLSNVLMSTLKLTAGTVGATADRTAPLLSMMVERIRGAIRTGGRIPLSDTAGSIPPEAMFHTLLLTARALIDTVPQLARVARISDDFTRTCYWSEQWLIAVRKGESVLYPTDPATPVTPPESAPSGGANWNSTALVDLTTDG